MNIQELDQQLLATIEDGQLTRKERRALKDALDEHAPNSQDVLRLRAMAFDIARGALSESSPIEVIDWLEGVTKVLARPQPVQSVSEAHFSPGDVCWQTVNRLLDNATSTVDICVFTITDDRIARAIERCHERSVRVRVISDNDKSEDRGSDIEKLERAGVPVRVDRTEAHMHNKYAVFDKKRLLTGSYNWTRSAATMNQENIIVTDDANLVRSFSRAFRELWEHLK